MVERTLDNDTPHSNWPARHRQPKKTEKPAPAARCVEVRPPEGAMLTFAAAKSPALDALFDAIIDLLLERIEQLTDTPKETISHDHHP